jgi:AcrR family transcriptional regulator
VSDAHRRIRATRTRAGQAPPIAPIYQRLPHGPHRLPRSEVVRNQRARLHGAMIRAVAEHGYARTSVKHVIGLAGVSRRSFYEQFVNKQDCLLATFDLLVQDALARIQAAYESTAGGLPERLDAALATTVDTIAQSPGAARLVLVETHSAGEEGARRLRRASAACEDMLAGSFEASRQAGALPRPVVRAIAGGLHGAACARLGAGRVPDRGDLLAWTLSFNVPPGARAHERLAAPMNLRARELALAAAARNSPGAPREAVRRGDERQRLLESTLRLAASHEYRELTAPQIADDAGVPIDVCLGLFENRDGCFLAALDMVGGRLAGLARAAGPSPDGIVPAVHSLMVHLAEHPSHARALTHGAWFAGAPAIERSLGIAREIAHQLTRGAARDEITLAAIAGAIVHTVRCQVAGGRLELLPALSEQLAFAVLAPLIGAQDALEVVCPTAGG